MRIFGTVLAGWAIRTVATVRPGGISAVGGCASRLTRPRGMVARVSSPGSLPEVRSNQSPEGRSSELAGELSQVLLAGSGTAV